MVIEMSGPETIPMTESAGPDPDREPADGYLLERFVSIKDQAAFAVLVRRHGPMVLGVCRRLLQDAHEAEDAFQATFLVLVHKAPSIRADLLGPWLHGVALRCAGQARQAARRRARQREAMAMPDTNPVVEVGRRDLRQVLDEELGQLGQKYRAPLVLVYLEGKSTEEVAQQLGCPRGTVLSRLARGRDRLRDRLVRRGIMLTLATLGVALGEQAAPAAVPAALAEATINAAAQAAAGTAAASAISASVATLTKGVLRAMLLKKLKVTAVLLLALAVAIAGTAVCTRLVPADQPVAAGKDATPKDEEKILGNWIIVSYMEGGKKAPAEAFEGARVVLAKGGKMSARLAGKEQEFTYQMDPTTEIKELDATNDKGQTVLGIYKLDGDTLTYCFARGGGRPTEFASPKGTNLVLEVLKRAPK
jgi:RNA polymerase sigma factor (sigma-70 family)